MNRVLAIVLVSLATAGCAGGAKPGAHDAAARLAPKGESPWHEDLGDPGLHALLAQSDIASLDVKLALARLERANAETDAAGRVRMPRATIGVEGAVGAARKGNIRSRGVPSLESDYEIDLWGRVASATRAAAAEAKAAAIDIEMARLLVAAETARAYVALETARAQEPACLRRSAAAARALSLVRLRAAAGRATPEELEARRFAVAEADGQTRQAHLEVGRQIIRLSALLGRDKLIDEPPVGHLTLPAEPPASISSDVVAQWPQVRAARARLLGADARRAEAVAASRPKFMINLAGGAVDPAVTNLLDSKSLVWAFGAGITHDILDGGAAKARVRGARAEVDLADLAYRKAVVEAWADLRLALGEASAGRDQAERATIAVAGAERALRAVEARHKAGAADGIDMAAGQDQLARALQSQAEARGRALTARVQLALALGGTIPGTP